MQNTFCLAWDQANGARLVDFHGWNMPVSYAKGVIAEHEATRTSAGLFNIAHMGRFRMKGPDALACSNYAFTNDLNRAAQGSALYGFLLNKDGGIIDDVIVYKEADDSYLWIVNAGGRESDLHHVMTLSKGRKVEFEQLAESHAMVALQGPKTAEVLKGFVTGVNLDRIPYFGLGVGEFQGKSVTLMATGYTGEDGFEIMMKAEDAPAIWAALATHPAVTPCGLGARDSLRLEAGLPLYGSDLDEETQPFEAGLGWAVKMDKVGGFVGREALRVAPLKKLVAMSFPERVIPRHGYSILCEGRAVGTVSSGVFGPTLKRGIAIGYIPSDCVGKPLSVDIRGTAVPVEVVKLPWVRHVTKKKA
jgi:aminomethyltransferase